MVGRVLGDQHRARDAACSIGMLLDRGIPEQLRIVLPADRKPISGARGSRANASEKPTVTALPVRPFAGTLEGKRIGARRNPQYENCAASAGTSSLSSIMNERPSWHARNCRLKSPK